MKSDTVLNTDLLTPSGRISACAAAGAPSFLLESVEQGRLGRYSLVGCGDRSSRSRRQRLSARRSSAISATTMSRSSSRRVQLPADGPRAAGEPFVVADTLVRFDHARRPRRSCRRRRPDRSSTRPAAAAARVGRRRRGDETLPDQADLRARRRGAARSTSARGDAFQIVLVAARRAAQRVSRRSLSIVRCAGSTPRLPVPARARRLALVGSSPETLVKCDGTRASGT